MCPAYGQECRKCKKKNHWASCCQSKAVNETKQYVIETITEDGTANVNACEATAIVKIEGSHVRVTLDTGADVNAVPKRVYDQLKKSNKKMTKTSVKLHVSGGHDIPVIGTIRLECSVNDVRKSLDFYVAQTKSKTILGLKSCRDMMLVKIMDEVNEKSAEKNTDEENQKNIIEENVKRISGKKGDDLMQKILKLYPEVFTGLGRLEPPYHMQLEENSTPVIHAPRKIPVSLRSKLKKELDGMEAAGVIEKVEEPTEWVNSLVVVENLDGSLRLCLDPRDLNKVIKREHFQLPTFEDISTRLAEATHFTKLDAKKGYWQIPLDEESAKLTTMNSPFGR